MWSNNHSNYRNKSETIKSDLLQLFLEINKLKIMKNWIKKSIWAKIIFIALFGGICALIGTKFTDTISVLVIFMLSGMAIAGFIVGIINMIKYDK